MRAREIAPLYATALTSAATSHDLRVTRPRISVADCASRLKKEQYRSEGEGEQSAPLSLALDRQRIKQVRGPSSLEAVQFDETVEIPGDARSSGKDLRGGAADSGGMHSSAEEWGGCRETTTFLVSQGRKGAHSGGVWGRGEGRASKGNNQRLFLCL